MFIVLFEVNPRQDRWDDYLGNARLLRPELEQIDGFIDNERFASQRRPGWLLSLSTWRDEKAVIRWRTFAPHFAIQVEGRSGIFQDYHLRVGEVTADTHIPPGHILREQRFDTTETGDARMVTLTDSKSLPADAAAPGLVGWDGFESITAPGKMILLEAWREADRRSYAGATRQRRVRVIRDYALLDRREAPQYHSPP